jgi:hypothetical protein
MSLDIISTYAIEFIQLPSYPFNHFFDKYFEYLFASLAQLNGLSLESLSNIAITLATYGKNQAEHTQAWVALRQATILNLRNTENKLQSAQHV